MNDNQEEYDDDFNLIKSNIKLGFSDLKSDEFLTIALHLSYENIVKYCQTNSYINNVVCRNDYFWMKKYIKDFGLNQIEGEITKYNGKWNDLYRTTGLIFGCGTNTWGNLGLGDNKSRKYLTRIFLGSPYNPAKKITVGLKFTAVVDVDNYLWIFGSLFETNFLSPIKLDILVKDIAAGYEHLLVVDTNDNLLVVGDNKYGQLGIDNVSRAEDFYKFESLKVKNIFADKNQSFIVDTNDNLWASGDNSNGQLGIGTNKNAKEFTLVDVDKSFGNIKKIVSDSHTAILYENGLCCLAGNNYRGQLGGSQLPHKKYYKFKFIPDIIAKDVGIGSDYTLIIDDNNDIWTVGTDYGKGALGLGNSYKNLEGVFSKYHKFKAKKVVTYTSHTFFTLEDDKILVCGGNNNWQLPVSATMYYTPHPLRTNLKHDFYTSHYHTISVTRGRLSSGNSSGIFTR